MGSIYKEIAVMLRGGLNTAVDPSIIGDDQMQESYGMEYRPPRLGLFACKGRSRGDSGTILGNKVFGLAWCGADGAPADGYLVALASPSATAFGYCCSAQSDGTLAFGAIGVSQIPTATHLWDTTATAFGDAVHHRGIWHFFNGANKNLVLQESQFQVVGGGPNLNWRQHGLIAVTATGVAIATATGAGGASQSFAVGAYEVWHTEKSIYVTDREGISIESAYAGTVQTVNVTAAGIGIKYTLPAAGTNSGVITTVVYCTPVNQKYPFGFSAGSIAFVSGSTYLTSPDATEPYAIVASYGAVPVSANSEPPKAAAMEVYKGSLCMIDADDKRVLRFSLPDEPYAVPDINYVPVETPFEDSGKALKSVNDVLLWFSSRHVIRFNYLPRHTDSQDITAGRGDCYDIISEAHGCMSPRGAATFSVVEGQQLCLFVCRDGIHITDGERIGYASEDLDWDALVSIANLSRCVLKNNPKKHRVEFYYVDATDTTKRKRLDFYYHPLLIQARSGGFPRLPVLGPLPVPGLAPAVGYFNSETQVWCGDDNNPRVWIEATGTADNAQLENADGRITKSWKTKNFYFSGLQGEYDLYKLYTHQSQTTASGSYVITAEGKTDDTATSFICTSTVDQSETGAQPHPALHARAQRFAIRGEKTDGGAWQELNYLVFVVKGASELHSAKSS